MLGFRSAAGALALLLAVVVSGCSPGADATEPSPAPSSPVSQTPTETPRERQERLDYAAAEKSYRTFRAEYERVLRAGGATSPTTIMKRTAGGPYLDTFTEVMQGFKKLGSRHVGLERIVYVRRVGYSPKTLVLDVCEDSRHVTTVRKSKKNQSGGFLSPRLTVRRTDGRWRIWDGTGEEVKSCG